MILHDDIDLANSRKRLRELEERYGAHLRETEGDAHVRELTIRSLKRYINQLKEDIVRYEAHQPAQRSS
jgi:hypothetical protein